MSPQLIWYDVKEMRVVWAEKYRDLEGQKIEELARLDHLEMEAYSAWERSKVDKEVVMTEVDTQGVITRTTTQRTGQVGDPRFLAEISKIVSLRCKILGLEAPTKILSIQVRWDLLTQEQIDRLASGEEYVRVLEPSQYFLG